MGKRDLQVISGGRAIEAYRRQQSYVAEPYPADEVIEYVPASEVEAKAPQIIHTQNNHYHHYPPTHPRLEPGKAKVSDSEFLAWLMFVMAFGFFLLGFISSACVR